MSWTPMITFIVTVANAPLAKKLAANFPGGNGMWTVPVYTNGVITDYISYGKIQPQFLALLSSAETLSAATGISLSLAKNLLDSSVIVEDSAHEVLSRLGKTLEPPEVDQ